MGEQELVLRDDLPLRVEIPCVHSIWVGCGDKSDAVAAQGSVEDRYQAMRAAKAEAAATEVPEKDEDGKPLTKKARAALQRAAELVRAAANIRLNLLPVHHQSTPCTTSSP